MPKEFYIAVGSIGLAFVVLSALMWHNLKVAIAEKQERVEARKRYKKLKNERLRKFYNLKKPNQSS